MSNERSINIEFENYQLSIFITDDGGIGISVEHLDAPTIVDCVDVLIPSDLNPKHVKVG